MGKKRVILFFLLSFILFNIKSIGADTCTDSDGGANYLQFGFVTVTYTNLSNTSIHYDLCDPLNQSSNLLFEAYCSNNLNGYISYNCPSGCNNGACLTTCQDSDGGINYVKQGTVSFTNSLNTYTDVCENNKNLVEFFCATPWDLGSGGYNCNSPGNGTYGCSDGACLTAPPKSGGGGSPVYKKATQESKEILKSSRVYGKELSIVVGSLGLLVAVGLVYSSLIKKKQ